MLHIGSLREGLVVFKALGSQTRISILDWLGRHGPANAGELSEALRISPGALTPHLRLLMDAGLVRADAVSGKHGVQKVLSLAEDKILLEFVRGRRDVNVLETEIGVGQYTKCEIYPTCGLACAERIIGRVDDPRYFASPERVSAGILWLGQGYVEYMLPNFLEEGQTPIELQLSMELASEAPGFSEDWPSDISFYLNGVKICDWTSPADFGNDRGIFTPEWWPRNWNQHGLFKLLSINENGAFIDGVRLSAVTLGALGIAAGTPLAFRVGVESGAVHKGGLTIYGRSFGNYDQGIKMRMHYSNTISERGNEQ